LVYSSKPYDFEIIHKPGLKNQNADALSRRSYDEINSLTVEWSGRHRISEQSCAASTEVPLFAALDIADERVSEIPLREPEVAKK
jgi:hypothetical protein